MPLKLNGTNSVAAPAYAGDDADTGLQCGTNELKLVTGGTEAVTVDSSQQVGIGTDSPSSNLHISSDQAGQTLRLSNTDVTSYYSFGRDDSGNLRINDSTNGELIRIQPSGNVGIGTSTPQTKLDIRTSAGTDCTLDLNEGTTTNAFRIKQTSTEARIQTTASQPVVIASQGGSGSTSNIRFETRDTERLRITSGGSIRFNQTTSDTPGFGNTTIGSCLQRLSSGAQLFISRSDSSPFLVNRNSNGTVVDLRRSGSQKGNIQVTTTTATFNSASDYRLKENVVALSDGITRLKQLSPSRFNFIEEPSITVDGFIAHEVQAVVPEAVTGTHNEVDDDGNPVMQGMDYGKVTPLLTAALQEAIAKIETLETKVAALEAAS